MSDDYEWVDIKLPFWERVMLLFGRPIRLCYTVETSRAENGDVTHQPHIGLFTKGTESGWLTQAPVVQFSNVPSVQDQP